MVRVPLDELERMGFAHRAEIEVDREESIAVMKLAGVVFYSVLPPAVNGSAA
jgi:hypothetical protein